MYEQHERCYTLIVRAANLRGEHERLGNCENKYRFCMSYHFSLALIELASALVQAERGPAAISPEDQHLAQRCHWRGTPSLSSAATCFHGEQFVSASILFL